MIKHQFYKEIPLFKMEIFNQFVQHKTLSKTGRALGLTPADVNNVILGIEKALGEPIYLRKLDRLVLTERGEEFLKICQAMIEAIEKLDLDDKTSKPEEITLAASLWDAEHYLPEILVEFAKKYPDVSVNLLVGADQTAMNNPDCDAAIGLALPKRPEIQQRLLLEVVIKLCASKNYLKKHSMMTAIRDLKGHRILNHSSLPPLPDSMFRNNHYAVTADSFAPLIELVLRDQGIALMPSQIFDLNEKCAKNCVEVLPDFDVQRYGLYFLSRPVSSKTEMIETLFNLISKKYSTL